ncbi:MAG: tetratricopeptide repeat protein [Rickettsiales bacterium]|jgi:Tfp pilus assembly protein PilF|nr:tetratricopeptide repeat protein [Rickettsiales bacterium]
MRYPILFASLLLFGCEGGVGAIDAKKVLSSIEGPKVPTVSETMAASAAQAESQGDYASAAQFYEQALEKEPDNKVWMVSLAESYRRSGNLQKAIAVYDAALALDAAYIPAKEGKALALMEMGDFEAPVLLLDEVIKSEPKRWRTLNALGILFSMRGMQPEAQAYFTEALKQNPSSASVLNNTGLSLALAKQYDAAIASLLRSVSLAGIGNIERKRIELNLSLVYATAGKVNEAKEIAQRYFTGAELNNNLGLYAHLAKDDQLAKAYLNMALTDSKVFYERAWDNLQLINSQGSAAPAMPN